MPVPRVPAKVVGPGVLGRVHVAHPELHVEAVGLVQEGAAEVEADGEDVEATTEVNLGIVKTLLWNRSF